MEKKKKNIKKEIMLGEKKSFNHHHDKNVSKSKFPIEMKKKIENYKKKEGKSIKMCNFRFKQNKVLGKKSHKKKL